MGRMVMTAIGVALLSLATVGTGGTATTLSGPGIIRITGQVKKFTRVDLGRRGYSPGDMEITRLRLFNRRLRKRPLGNGQMVCTATGEKFWNCAGTYILPAGKITVAGALVYPAIYDMAVTGGSDTYRNVRGTLFATKIGRNEKLLVFRLVIS